MDPTRVIIYACVTDIVGSPQRRHLRLGEDLCMMMNRPFQAALSPAGYDHVHIPADFDSENPIRRWFIVDLNVTQALSREEVSHIPHQVYLASRQNGKLTFIARDHWADKAKARAASYIWGGRQEQKMIDVMRNENKENE
ncbi:hypothetical protein MYU51_011051 [Penicillium brevicompactum]|uniref:uncharacterized protein n=1 Tax=Penicillium brevicompactum TaxID=5074 RepID=UPI002541A68E|nr:uncharacterized protein N7506_001458 [Penicillium brevicompactum]KAJ5348205.1 hypothetical protein N7506_001458 [Penicillium brevicompactum]